MKSCCLPLLVGLSVAPSLSQAKPRPKINLKSGLYEITGDMTSAGMKMPRITTTECLDMDNLVPSTGTSDAMRCKEKITVDGDLVKWKIDCTMEGGVSMKTEGEVRYRGTTFKGTARYLTHSPAMPQPVPGDIVLAGRRIGPCTDGRTRR